MKIKRPLVLLGMVFTLLVYIILLSSGGIDEYEYFKDGESVCFTGVVKDKEVKNGRNIIYISNCVNKRNYDEESESVHEADNTINDNNFNKKCSFDKMIGYLDSQNIEIFRIGQNVEIYGTFDNFDIPENEGQFNSRKYYRIRGYNGMLKNSKITKASVSYSRYKDTLYSIKNKTRLIFYEYMSDENASTLSAMVIGDKTGIDSNIKELYQDSGIAHVLSLSGLHVATIGIAIYSGCMFCGLGIYYSSIVSGFLMISYALMTGMQTSTRRALIMFFLAILAKNIGRTYDLLSGTFLSAILILIENPYYVFDSGFLLSFFAVAGIALIYPIIYELTKIKSISVSLSVNLATMPIVINSFYKIPVYGVFLNLIVVPLLGIILICGVVAGIIGNICLILNGKCIAVGTLLFVAEKILNIYSFAATKTSNYVGNTWVVGKCSVWQVIIYATIFVVIIGLHNSKCGDTVNNIGQGNVLNNTKRGNTIDNTNKDSALNNTNKEYGVISRYKKITETILICIAVFIISIKVWPDYELNVLSVGQGACSVIYGKNLPVVMIDGGSSDIKDVGKYRIKPFLLSKGIATLDYVFVSHADLDHVSGIKELLSSENKDIRIKNLILSVFDDEIIRLAKEKNVKTYLMSYKDRIKDNNLEIICLSPSKSLIEEENGSGEKDANETSLVLKIVYSDRGNSNAHENKKNDFSVLFPGDISMKTEENLPLSELKSDVLIVPHHGSKYSSGDAFIKGVSPNMCVISSGKNNSYGHPHIETLNRLEKYVGASYILRTDRLGQIKINSRGKRKERR